MQTINKAKSVTVIQWSDGSVNKFKRGDSNISDFVSWKKQKLPNIRVVCRYNAPCVATAFALIRQGIGCRIEGRDIGQNLINLCNKWKRVSDLSDFSEKLTKFFNKEFEKASNAKLAMLEDKLDTMLILIERCQSLGKNDMYSLRKLIEDMFTDNGDVKNANVVTLSSIHKSKGLEFNTCWVLGNNQFIPSK